ncbi:MAG TPA: NUDIX domain-containing protein [Rubrobacteraceae bacterium]|nr:NUDIX domain-containing protein [Rubrobacteraceae bacterium]
MTPDETENPWLTLSSKEVYDNPWITVREDRVVRPDGEPGIYGVVHYKNIAVGILAVEDDHVYLVGQYRYPLGRYSWEIPEGGCPQGEEPLRAAQRELREETGLQAARWRMLGEAYLSNSVADEHAVWFLATGLVTGEWEPEGTERLRVRRVPLGEALNMALEGEITDALSLLALASYALRDAADASYEQSRGGDSRGREDEH